LKAVFIEFDTQTLERPSNSISVKRDS